MPDQYNPGIYHDTLWQFGVTILERTTEEPVNISAMTIVVDVYDRAGEAAVFQFSGAGDADTGEVDMTGAGAGVFIVRATASQHAAVTPGGPYYWEARNVADALDPQYVANGTLYVGKAGERQTKWEVLNTYEGTFGQASLPGVIITVAGDVLVRDTLTALRAVNSGIARTTYVLGHTAAGDGGAGMFRWDADSEEDDDDGLVVLPDDLTSSDPGRYIREFEGHLNVRMWGVIDDDAATAQTTAMQRALDACSARRIPLFQNEGRYLLGQIKPGPDTYWYGPKSAVLVPDGALSRTTVFIVNKNVSLDAGTRLDSNITIKGMTFDGSERTFAKWLMDSDENPIEDPEADYVHPTGVMVSGLTLPTFEAHVSNGRVTSVTVLTPGAGFGTHPTHPYTADEVSLKFTGGGGYGAKAAAGIESGSLTDVFMLAGGRDYTTAPDVEVIGGYAAPTLLVDASVNRRNPNFTQIAQCIAMQKVDGYTIEDCTFLDYGAMVVADQGCRDGVIRNNHFERCGKSDGPYMPIWVGSFGNPLNPTAFYQDTENCHVLYNTARDLERLFVLFAPTKGGILAGNKAKNTKEGCFFIAANANKNGGYIVARDNEVDTVVISDIVADGFELNAPAKNIILINNRVTNTQGQAVTATGVSNLSVLNNYVLNCGSASDERLPFGPFSERYAFGQGTAVLADTYLSFPTFSIGYAASIPSDNVIYQGNVVQDTRDEDVPFYVFNWGRSGDPPSPACTNHLINGNIIQKAALTEFMEDKFSEVFEPNGLLCWNNPGSGWTGFMPKDDKYANQMMERITGEGAFFIKNQLSPDSYIGMITKLGLATDLVLCLDPGDSNSYSSGQQWSDVSGDSNHYYRGTTSGSDSTDPTFNGIAGNESANEFWSVDGGDYFTPTAAHTFASTWHQNNAAFTLIMVVKLGTEAVNQTLFSTLTSTPSGTGITLAIVASLSVPQLSIYNAGTPVADFAVSSVIADDDFVFIAYSIDEAGDYGDAFGVVGAFLNEFDPTYDTPAAGAADGAPNIFATTNGSTPMTSGSRLAAVLAWDRALTPAEVSRVRNALSLRFPSI